MPDDLLPIERPYVPPPPSAYRRRVAAREAAIEAVWLGWWRWLVAVLRA